MAGYASLRVWQQAHRLALQVYIHTQSFPREEVYGLTGQMRRAAVSIASNLAEGSGRNSRAELARFGRIALGSASELEYQLLLARDLRYLDEDAYARLAESCDHIRRMLAALVRSLSA